MESMGGTEEQKNRLQILKKKKQLQGWLDSLKG